MKLKVLESFMKTEYIYFQLILKQHLSSLLHPLSTITGRKNRALQVPPVVPYKALENFSKALYGTTRGTCSARFFRPVIVTDCFIHLSASENGQTSLKNSFFLTGADLIVHSGYIMCLSGIQYGNSIRPSVSPKRYFSNNL